jgi:hypothetical protein
MGGSSVEFAEEYRGGDGGGGGRGCIGLARTSSVVCLGLSLLSAEAGFGMLLRRTAPAFERYVMEVDSHSVERL